MSFFDGSSRILYVKIGVDWIPIACLTSNSLNEDVEMLDTTTRQAGSWTTGMPTIQSGTIEFDGLQVLTEGEGADTTKASYDRLKVIKRARTKIEWKIEDSGLTFIDEGEGYITSLSEASDVGDFLLFSGSIQIYGEPIFSTQIGTYIFQNGETYLLQNGQPFLFN